MNRLRTALFQSVSRRTVWRTPVVAPSGSPPDLVTEPVISDGQPQVGVAQSYTPGTWSGAATVTANWMIDDVAVLDAIANPTYTPVVGDVDKHLSVMETATASGGAFSTASTQAKTVVA